MKINQYKRIISALLACLTVITSTAILPGAQTLAERFASQESNVNVFEKSQTFSDISKQFDQKNYKNANDNIKIALKDYNQSSKNVQILQDYQGKNNVLLQNNECEYIEWDFDVKESGLYNLLIEYIAYNDNYSNIERMIYIDNEIPYQECEYIKFDRFWQDDGEVKTNQRGDQIKPNVKQVFKWTEFAVSDEQGRYQEPLKFYLDKGVHKLKIKTINNPIVLSKIEFNPPKEIPLYQNVLKEYNDKGYKSATNGIRIEAEKNVAFRTDSTVRMVSEKEPSVYPQSYKNVVMNAIGGNIWGKGNSSITWNVTALESGLYKIMLRDGQWHKEGMPIFRKIEIDGEVPFKEFEAYQFVYDKNWRSDCLTAEDGEPYLVYLKEGTHSFTMTAKQGEAAKLIEIFEKDAVKMSELILKTIMITGQDPDLAYDYELDKKIPGLIQTFKDMIDNINYCIDFLEKLIPNGKMPSVYNQLKVTKEELGTLIKDPFYIPAKLKDLNSTLTSYGNYISWFKEQPMVLDYIQFLPVNQTIQDYKANFFQKLSVSIYNFFSSFFKDYDSIQGYKTQDTEITSVLDVWIARGKDWGNLIQQLADESFTTQYGIGIKINILPAGQLNAGTVNAMMLAIASGRAPDVGMGSPGNSIGEFALRNALVNLTEFDDYEQVSERFYKAMLTPLTYNNNVYGLPETMSFKAMFYRKDLISELGIAIPNTWNELYSNVIPVLSQNNMQFFYPVNYEIMLFQNSGEFYKDNLTMSALDSPQAYSAFKELCELYTLQGVPVSADFFNRFRTGEMPIGIGDFTTYMTLLAAAPELNGRWGIAQIPGHITNDGKINRSQGSGLSEATMILSQTDKKNESWKFLKWWTSEETQSQFAEEIEAVMGQEARWNTANKKAYAALPWNKENYKVIEKTFEEVNEIPVVLGGYFTTRHINNAFNRVVISNMNARDSLEQAVKDVNKELIRRRESFGKNKNIVSQRS